MTKIDDGAPAFPLFADGRAAMHDASIAHDGMSLRDYFAAAALQGLLASGPHDCGPNGIAHDAWEQADAMLKARKEKG